MSYLFDLILHAFVFLVLLLSYIMLERAYRALSHPNAGKTNEVKGFDIPSPQIKQLQKDVDRANDIGDGALLLFQKLNENQQALKVDVDKVLSNIRDLQESLKSIDALARGFANISDLHEAVKSIDAQTRRFANILLGPQSKGALGEKIIEQQLDQLPKEWIWRNVPYPGNQKVEYALRVPDARIIPIDSKWTGTELLDQLGKTTDPSEQKKIKDRIVSGVWQRAREVRKYLDKDRTLGFCIVAVPDPVFEISWGKQVELRAFDIVLVSYSLLIPYILSIVKLFWSSAQSIQALQTSYILDSSLARVQQLHALIDTDMRLPLNSFDQRQTEYDKHTEQLKEALDRLSQIHKDLSAIQSSSAPVIDPLTKLKFASIAGTLKDQIAKLGDGLRDGLQNGPNENKPEQ